MNPKLFSETVKKPQLKDLSSSRVNNFRDMTYKNHTTLNNDCTYNPSQNTSEESEVNDKWEEVVNKRRRKIIVNGANTSAKLRVISKNKALFVTRFGPETNSEDIEDFIKENKNILAKVTKLKTKHNSYASFHVEVRDSDFETLFTSEIWPEGSMISEFYGRLRTEHSDTNSTESISTE
ncbi:hypothetical protein C0J52_04384 [Blattella germanica]|nr:hypothetical protein C0J52_04384 [Blattella germanica]